MRVTVAIQAGAHGKRSGLGHDCHLTHIAVTVLAPYPRAYMHHVSEVNEIGKLVNSFPEEALTSCRCVAQSNDTGSVRYCRVMAVHTAGHGGNRGMPRNFGAQMAMAAIKAHLSGMQLMRITDGLNR